MGVLIELAAKDAKDAKERYHLNFEAYCGAFEFDAGDSVLGVIPAAARYWEWV